MNKLTIAGRYRATKLIATGSSGKVYSGVDISTGSLIAVKAEPIDTPNPRLEREYHLYVDHLGKCLQVPQIKWYGEQADHRLLVMDLMGPSLEQLFTSCKRKLTNDNIRWAAREMLCQLETLHGLGFIHRDVRPENFLLYMNSLYLVNFGLSMPYQDRKTGEHTPLGPEEHLTTTVRYAARNAHLGLRQSRRDDLESLGYILVYLHKGTLPWQNLTADNVTQKLEKVHERKLSITVEKLCAGLPEEFAHYHKYCRSLKYADQPNYAHLKEMFAQRPFCSQCKIDNNKKKYKR